MTTFFYSTEGASWLNTEGWLSNESICDWRGITCVDGRVTKLNQNKNGLAGSLPAELSALSSLSTLEVFMNSIGGALPTELFIPSITGLDLEENNFTGELFSEDLLSLDGLEILRASINGFTGTIPEDIDRLSSLTELWIGENENFSAGIIPNSITSLTKLSSIIAYNCGLTGTLPENIGNLTDVRNLDLHNNGMTGSIPGSLGSMTNLKKLFLEDNDFTGTIPDSTSQLTELQRFFANDNALIGPIPDYSSFSKLKLIVLANNTLTGSMPAFSSPVLEFLALHNNALSGNIPDIIFTSEPLRIVYLNNNTFTGPIPANYVNAIKLQDLYLNDNTLTGTIPSPVPGQLPNITEILLNGNRLSGDVPDGLCDLREALPIQFFALHADCNPTPPNDDPNNPCQTGCCTDCFSGKVV